MKDPGKQVPNICPLEQGGIQSKHNARCGRKCQVPHVKTNAPSAIQKQCMVSLSIRGPRLSNALPARVRDIPNCSTDIFKRSLDRYIATILDEPQIHGYTAFRKADTNSLLDMTQAGDIEKSTDTGGHPWSPGE